MIGLFFVEIENTEEKNRVQEEVRCLVSDILKLRYSLNISLDNLSCHLNIQM